MGGGKGGVGKSFILSNLAIALARRGNRVVIIDLDLGSANLHTCFGSDIPQKTLTDFFSGRCSSLEEIINPTSVPTLQFISGANDSVAAANLGDKEIKLLFQHIESLPCDYVLFDLGAGTHKNTLDLFNRADKGLVAITPEPTAIENAYRFIKSAFYQWVKTLEKDLKLKSTVDKVMDHKNQLGIKTPMDLIRHISNENPKQGLEFSRSIERYHLNLIMNQVRTQQDVDTGHAIASVCKKYFGINSSYVGYLEYDNVVWQAVRKRRPVLLEFPQSSLTTGFTSIVTKLDDERHTGSELLRTS